jgi:hypothetical protein
MSSEFTGWERRRATVHLAPLLLAGIFALCSPAPLSPQVIWQPQPAPLVTAEGETWFRLGEPIAFEGYVYYPAGARVFFDPNVMVRSGTFRGIPIYIDTTIEAYSRIFLPISGGLLQPYERRRTGDVAGTTGSRAPSFPVSIAGEPSEEPATVGAAGSVEVTSPEPRATTTSGVSTTSNAPRPQRHVVEAGRRPKGLNEIYVSFSGYRWRVAGKAVPLSENALVMIGHSGHFPVYAPRGETASPRLIYIPSRLGLVAPYERAGKPPTY